MTGRSARALFGDVKMPKKNKNQVDKAAERILDHLPPAAPRRPKSREKNKDEIVSRRDERGIPYPGDFPNPASDRTRGCF